MDKSLIIMLNLQTFAILRKGYFPSQDGESLCLRRGEEILLELRIFKHVEVTNTKTASIPLGKPSELVYYNFLAAGFYIKSKLKAFPD